MLRYFASVQHAFMSASAQAIVPHARSSSGCNLAFKNHVNIRVLNRKYLCMLGSSLPLRSHAKGAPFQLSTILLRVCLDLTCVARYRPLCTRLNTSGPSRVAILGVLSTLGFLGLRVSRSSGAPSVGRRQRRRNLNRGDSNDGDIGGDRRDHLRRHASRG